MERQIQTDRQKNSHSNGVSATAQAILDQKDLERCEAEIKRITESVDSHVTLQPEERAKRKTLREKAEILRKKLHYAV